MKIDRKGILTSRTGSHYLEPLSQLELRFPRRRKLLEKSFPAKFKESILQIFELASLVGWAELPSSTECKLLASLAWHYVWHATWGGKNIALEVCSRFAPMEQPEFCTTKFVTIFGHYQVFVPGNSLTRSRETRIPPGRELINFATPKFKNNSRASTQATTTSLSLFFKEPIKERQTTINSNNKKLQATIKHQETKQTKRNQKEEKRKTNHAD